MFGFNFNKKTLPVPALPSSGLSNGLIDAICASLGSRSIPTMPGAAQKAFQLSVDPNAEARDFIDVIESDESLSARVLKIANSVYFDRGKSSNTIEEAVIVIGLNELRCLLSATTLSEIFPSNQPLRTQLWANDIATALIARTLGARLLPNKQELLFLGGLMHDIGKLLLLQRLPAEYLEVAKRVENRGIEFVEAEHESFVFDHTEVGQLIGERWNFSAELQSILRNHHRAFADLPSNDSQFFVAGIVKAADLIAHALGLGHGRGFHKLRSCSEVNLNQAWEYLNIPASDQKALLDGAKRSFDTEYDLYAGKDAK